MIWCRSIKRVLAACVLLVGMPAFAVTFTTSQECRDIWRKQRAEWETAYNEQTKCWSANRCGNPGADRRLTQWFADNQVLGEQCDRLATAERTQAQQDRELRAAQRQQEAEQRQQQQRTTTVPLQSPSTRPSANSSAARTGAALDALGRLFQDRAEREAEREAAEETEAREARTTATARQRIEGNNQRAYEIFKKARSKFDYHKAVKAVQDFAWDRLKDEVKRATDSMATIEMTVDAIVKDAPNRELIGLAPSSVKKIWSRTDNFGGQSYSYLGQVNVRGEPHGLGFGQSMSPDKDGITRAYWGQFVDGEATGLGTWEESTNAGVARRIVQIPNCPAHRGTSHGY